MSVLRLLFDTAPGCIGLAAALLLLAFCLALRADRARRNRRRAAWPVFANDSATYWRRRYQVR